MTAAADDTDALFCQAVPACRHTPTVGVVCRSHHGQLGQWLADLPALIRGLSHFPTVGEQVRGGGLASHRTPGRTDVLVLADRRSRERDPDDPDGTAGRSVEDVLGSWALEIRDGRGLHIADNDPTGWRVDRALIVAHLDWSCAQPWIDEKHRDLKQLWAALRAANGFQRPRPAAECWVPTGAAPDGTVALCGGPVWAKPGQAHCDRCGTVWTGAALLRIRSELDQAASA